MKRIAAIAGSFTLLWMLVPAWGQTARPIAGLQVGQTVTIQRDGGTAVKGKVVRLDEGSVVVDAGNKGGVMQVANSSIVSIGRKSRAKGAMLGLAAGFGIGFAVGFSAGPSIADDEMTESERAGTGLGMGLIFGGALAGVGAAAGAQSTIYKRP